MVRKSSAGRAEDLARFAGGPARPRAGVAAGRTGLGDATAGTAGCRTGRRTRSVDDSDLDAGWSGPWIFNSGRSGANESARDDETSCDTPEPWEADWGRDEAEEEARVGASTRKTGRARGTEGTATGGRGTEGAGDGPPKRSDSETPAGSERVMSRRSPRRDGTRSAHSDVI